MKRTFVCLLLGMVLWNCGNGDNKGDNKEGQAETTAPAQEAETTNPEVQKGLQLVAGSDCFTCHQIKTKSVGPAYEEIANKYPNNQEVIDSLAGKVIKGGAGNWGQVPMTAHPNLSEEDAKTMVKYVLSLKQ